MTTAIPITLVGDNLAKRHKYLNSLVNETHKKGEEFNSIKKIPEKSHIDRLFKIELASKSRNVDYIIQNLKDDDMLFVSRALKATWLIESQYEDIINPENLEDRLYPEMITTAVNKMQHWIHLNLTDERRCHKFYQYYRNKNFELAMKFYLKCSKDVIQNEFPHIIHKITPHHLKVLSEKCPEVAKSFFSSIFNDDGVKILYLTKESKYFNTLRHLLKTNTEMVLDFTEKYFNNNVFNRFSAMQSKFIMKHYKNRFWKKPELYTGWILNTPAVAESLNSEESKDLVLKLARANYMTYPNWFNYERIEPFIKRLKPEDRSAFKKLVFVEKNVGEIENEWPYEIPKPPVNEIEYATIFDDRQPKPDEYEHLIPVKKMKRLIKKKCGRRMENDEIMECCAYEGKVKTLLDKLFDEFRFASFGQTLHELRKRIAAESSPKNREFMIFVLISKTGGRPDAVASLLELLERHSNEPDNVRAAIIRSLVKRAQIWRLPKTSWDQLMKFGQGLGLNGKTSDADCYEGLHAVIIRSLLQNEDLNSDIKNTFLGHFSTLIEYALNSEEKKTIRTALPNMLLAFSIQKSEAENFYGAVCCIDKLIDTLDSYEIRIDTFPGLIDTIIRYASTKGCYVEHLIFRLFNAKIARKQLFKFSSELLKTDDSYLNSLKHDISVLNAKEYAEQYGTFILHTNKFLRKLSLYFSEDNGLAGVYLKELKAINPSKIHGRLIAYLLNSQFVSYLSEIDVLDDKKFKLLASAIRGNANLVRPAPDIDVFGWKKIGAKHVGNKLSKCRAIDIDNNIKKLLEWKRTAKNALALSKRTNYQTEVFIKFASIKPTSAIQSGLKFIKRHGDKADTLIWKTIKPIIQNLDITMPSRNHLVKQLGKIYEIPIEVRPEYSTVIYKLLLKKTLYHAMPSLCHVEILLPDVNEQFVENFVTNFLQNDFIIDKLSNDDKDVKCVCMFIRIFVKYLLQCKNEVDQKRKLETYFEPLLSVLEQLKESDDKNKLFKEYFPEMLLTLKYSQVFLSTEYVSPLPIIEKIIAWMKKHFTVAEHFKSYALLHLLMLYYKSTQQAITLVPEVFSDTKRKSLEGVKLVGKIFGKYIASEVNNLQQQYFESIPELYIRSVAAFLDKYNYYFISSDLISSIVEGMLEGKRGSRLGIYLIEEKRYSLSNENYQKLLDCIRKLDSVESNWFISLLV